MDVSPETCQLIAKISLDISYSSIFASIILILGCLFKKKIPGIHSIERMRDVILITIVMSVPLLNVILIAAFVPILIGVSIIQGMFKLCDRYPAKRWEDDPED